jgi:rRNA maturation RNase YbeY
MLTVEHDHADLDVDETRLSALIHHVIDAEDASLRFLSVVLTDHETVLRLNREYLDHDYHTDVLSFDLTEDGSSAIEGEVYVDLDTAQERHSEFDTTFEEEALRYAVHGVLHLIGYDDADPEDAQTMRTLEDRYLQSLH